MTRSRVVVAVSGTGRTLENLVRLQSEFAYEIVGVIASKPDCRGVDLARQFDLPLLVHHFPFENDEKTKALVYDWLEERRADWVALAGFVRKFPIHADWNNRIINIHPALLPKFGGKGMYGHRVHAAVIKAGEAESGATMHFVNEVYDDGKIIAQAKVPVHEGDTPDLLAARVFEAETQLYPRVLDQLVREAHT